MSPQVLQGEFVYLRPLQVGDAELTFNWLGPKRAKFFNQGVSSIEQQAAWIAARAESEHNFVVKLKSGLPVGMLSLIGINHANRHGEPGWFLVSNEDYLKGFPAAVEAMKLLYELAFDNLQLVLACSIVAANNYLMIKSQKYTGMKEEG